MDALELERSTPSRTFLINDGFHLKYWRPISGYSALAGNFPLFDESVLGAAHTFVQIIRIGIICAY